MTDTFTLTHEEYNAVRMWTEEEILAGGLVGKWDERRIRIPEGMSFLNPDDRPAIARYAQQMAAIASGKAGWQ